MKNIKDITISIFAIIGFVAILTSFNNQTQETPESHVWELIVQPKPSSPGADGWEKKYNHFGAMAVNKVTGEVRKYSDWRVTIDKNLKMENREENKYLVMVEVK